MCVRDANGCMGYVLIDTRIIAYFSMGVYCSDLVHHIMIRVHRR